MRAEGLIRLSKTPRSFRESASKTTCGRRHRYVLRMRELLRDARNSIPSQVCGRAAIAVVFTWLTHQPEGEDAILSAAHRACEHSEAARRGPQARRLLTSPSPKPTSLRKVILQQALAPSRRATVPRCYAEHENITRFLYVEVLPGGLLLGK